MDVALNHPLKPDSNPVDPKQVQDPAQVADATRLAAQRELAQSFSTLQELVAAARRSLSQATWDMLSGGSDSEATLRRNRMALDSLALRQRVLVDVRNLDTTTTLLGKSLPLPVFIAPIGNFLQYADPRGAAAVACAAVSKQLPCFISTAARPGIEAVAKAVDQPLIFQLYVRGDRQWVGDILDRAKAAGYDALCVTVDRAYYSRRERDMINRHLVREGGGDASHQASITWDDVLWMKQRMGVPLILKGIATAEDARLAVEHAVDVVYVSNHGGRQLDHAQASIEVLPEVAEAVDGRAEVLMDGGILRGTDIVKAVALGARAVGIGKLHGWALAAAGEPGVVRMIELLELEIRSALGLMGVTSLRELGPHSVRAATPVSTGSVTSAYPMYEAALRDGEGRP
ncbi:MAG: alpha-hydroxy-acid oxidizing protein [Proteobacteria bacterium]|nr:alpha-hydroxy-acid oxidizing protein [Burkholderiales bacterium]